MFLYRFFFAFIVAFSVNSVSSAQTFDDFQKILNKHLIVTDLPGGGLQTAFDYDAMLANSSSMKEMKQQIEKLSSFSIETLDTKEKATAFWINAYNFHMIRVVVERGFQISKTGFNSVKDLGSWFNPYAVFKDKFINIGGKSFSLDGIEKGILLSDDYKKKSWKDARIHFAVNCASVGCPPLIKNIYKADSLNQTLDENIRRALKTPRHLNIKGTTLHLTHLFKWYKTDFKEYSGDIKSFLKKYVDQPNMLDQTKSMSFIEYDWKLNSPKNFK